ARGGVLVSLVQEVRSVVVVRIGTVQAVENQVRVLVGLGLGRFDRSVLAGQRTWRRNVRTVTAEAVELESLRWILEAHRAFGGRALPQLGREQCRGCYAGQLRVRVRDFRQGRGLHD